MAGVAQFGGGEVCQARDGLQRDHERVVMDRIHDGPGQHDKPAGSRPSDGPGGSEAQHYNSRSAVHGHMGADVVRAQRLGTVHSTSTGGHG